MKTKLKLQLLFCYLSVGVSMLAMMSLPVLYYVIPTLVPLLDNYEVFQVIFAPPVVIGILIMGVFLPMAFLDEIKEKLKREEKNENND